MSKAVPFIVVLLISLTLVGIVLLLKSCFRADLLFHQLRHVDSEELEISLVGENLVTYWLVRLFFLLDGASGACFRYCYKLFVPASYRDFLICLSEILNFYQKQTVSAPEGTIVDLVEGVAPYGLRQYARQIAEDVVSQAVFSDIGSAVRVFLRDHARYEKRMDSLFWALLHLAYYDNRFDRQEQDLLEYIRRYLKMWLKDFERIEGKVLDDRRLQGFSRPRVEKMAGRGRNFYKSSAGSGESNSSQTHFDKVGVKWKSLDPKVVQAFATLQCKPSDSLNVVKRRYRQLCKIYHPDVSGGSPSDKFREIQRAYEIIRDHSA